MFIFDTDHLSLLQREGREVNKTLDAGRPP